MERLIHIVPRDIPKTFHFVEKRKRTKFYFLRLVPGGVGNSFSRRCVKTRRIQSVHAHFVESVKRIIKNNKIDELAFTLTKKKRLTHLSAGSFRQSTDDDGVYLDLVRVDAVLAVQLDGR